MRSKRTSVKTGGTKEALGGRWLSKGGVEGEWAHEQTFER